MIFKDFIENKTVRKSSKDEVLAKSLLKTAEKDKIFLDGLEVNSQSSRKIMSNYYDVLRSILESISAIDGYKIYSHEAFMYYLIEKKEEVLAIKFDRFRKIRNAINYYGKDISIEETTENIREINKMIKLLIDKYLKDLR